MGASLGIVLLVLIMLAGPAVVLHTTPGTGGAKPAPEPGRTGDAIGPPQEWITTPDRKTAWWESRYAEDFELWELDS